MRIEAIPHESFVSPTVQPETTGLAAGQNPFAPDIPVNDQLEAANQNLSTLIGERKLAMSQRDSLKARFEREGEARTTRWRIHQAFEKVRFHRAAEGVFPLERYASRFQALDEAVREQKEEKFRLQHQTHPITNPTPQDLPADSTAVQPKTAETSIITSTRPTVLVDTEAFGVVKVPQDDLKTPYWKEWVDVTARKDIPLAQNGDETLDPFFSVFIVQGTQKEPAQIKTKEQLRGAMHKINGLGPVTVEDAWRKLKEILKMQSDPIAMMKRYRERVNGNNGSKFSGWYKAPMGKKWSIIFMPHDGNLHFRIGSHETIYNTPRKKIKEG